jgi:ABC-type glycerol-3-phosphate transport system substrate-binding protein
VGSILRPDTGFAMSSTCRDKDAAWEFLRGLLTEAGQKEVSSLPTNRSVFEARLQELMTTEYVTDAAGNQMLDEAGKPLQQSRVSWYDEEGVQHNVYSMSAEQAEQVRQIVEGCTRLAGYDREIFETVLEQAERFFSGELSENDVARLVQSNVSDYMRGQAGSVSGAAPDHP